MKRLSIMDITFNGFKPNDLMHDLADLFREKFKQANIHFDLSTRGDTIWFKEVDNNKLFISSIENKVLLKDDDERIKKLKRNYLNTNRLTKEQEDIMWNNCINNTLSSLGLCATIKLYEHYDEDENSFLILREGYEYKSWPILQKAYPVAST